MPATCHRRRWARKLVRQCLNAGEALFIPITVALELEWVLRSGFGFDKAAVVATLSRLLSTVELVFESERSLELALMRYRDGPAEFSDCVHLALASTADQSPLWTFDKAAAKVAGARLLTR